MHSPRGNVLPTGRGCPFLEPIPCPGHQAVLPAPNGIPNRNRLFLNTGCRLRGVLYLRDTVFSKMLPASAPVSAAITWGTAGRQRVKKRQPAPTVMGDQFESRGVCESKGREVVTGDASLCIGGIPCEHRGPLNVYSSSSAAADGRSFLAFFFAGSGTCFFLGALIFGAACFSALASAFRAICFSKAAIPAS